MASDRLRYSPCFMTCCKVANSMSVRLTRTKGIPGHSWAYLGPTRLRPAPAPGRALRALDTTKAARAEVETLPRSQWRPGEVTRPGDADWHLLSGRRFTLTGWLSVLQWFLLAGGLQRTGARPGRRG